MSYTLIRGRFYVVGYQPDGDSLRFEADSPQHWNPVGNVGVNNDSRIQLRFEGIDTPEVHVGQNHQPLDLANAARDRMLDILNITNVQYSANGKTITAANENRRGTILVSGVAIRRPICFVFSGDRFGNANSGSQYNPTLAQILSSVNATLLEEGHAYPLFYRTLDVAVRDAFTNLAIAAYNARRGLWPYDWSENFSARNLDDIEYYYCIFPKVFRRLLRYMRNHTSGRGFVSALAHNQSGTNDRLELVTNPDVNIRLADVLQQTGNSTTIKMLQCPEHLIFD
ncbi:MAG: thermonuclease family protein [Planctomycetota bacterium]|jgi:endonuclease YncB( thermonuclease family)